MGNAKAALWALLGQQQPAREVGEPHKQTYKELTTYLRYYYLLAYVSRHLDDPSVPCDGELLDRCWIKLRGRHALLRRGLLEKLSKDIFLL